MKIRGRTLGRKNDSYSDLVAREVLKAKYSFSSQYLLAILSDKVVVPVSARVKADLQSFRIELESLKTSFIEKI